MNNFLKTFSIKLPRTAAGYYTLTVYKKLSTNNKHFLKSYGYKIYEDPVCCCTATVKDSEVITLITWNN